MKKMMIMVVTVLMLLQLCACAELLEPNCKSSGCEDEVYEEGYCKFHYYENAGTDLLKKLIN